MIIHLKRIFTCTIFQKLKEQKSSNVVDSVPSHPTKLERRVHVTKRAYNINLTKISTILVIVNMKVFYKKNVHIIIRK